MFDHLSVESRRTLDEAQAEAGRLGHSFVGTEHLLLGVLDVEDSLAGALLANRGVLAEEIRALVARARAFQPRANSASLPLTARAKQVLALAAKEADELGSERVSPAHLLLGIIRQGTGVAGLVLEDLGVDLVMLRDDVLAALAVRSGRTGGAAARGSGYGIERAGAEPVGGIELDAGQPDAEESAPVQRRFVAPSCPHCERPLADHLTVSEIAPQHTAATEAAPSRRSRRGERSAVAAVVVVSCGACGHTLSASP